MRRKSGSSKRRSLYDCDESNSLEIGMANGTTDKDKKDHGSNNYVHTGK